MSELSTNKIKPVTQNTLTLGDSGDSIVLGTGATAVGFGSSPVTEDPNDPAVDTNPADGVGALWLNTTSGCLFSCTDATTDDNVWINTANCTDIIDQPFSYQGTISGYTSGGTEVSNQPSSEVVDRFSFSSSSATVDVGNLTVRRDNPSGQKSSTHGYTSGGHGGPGLLNTNVIDKFTFSADADATDVGDLTVNRHASCGQSSSTHGYTSGGLSDGDPGINEDVVDKFSFSSNNDATAHSNLTVARYNISGHSSDTHGWTTGGTIINQSNTANSITSNIIERFSFATQNSEADIDDLSIARADCSGHSSSTDGYSSGGSSTAITARIDKFSFSSTTTSTNVGNISLARNGAAGTSSTTHGYTSGGNTVTSTVNHLNTIDRFSYTTAGSDTGTDVGDLSVPRSSCSGTQV